MAEARQGDKTEKATPQRLRKAREQGQVPRSKDLAAALGPRRNGCARPASRARCRAPRTWPPRWASCWR
ncbi:EscU/YscU/HrcU family type III secretion system export apparatus switch protein [Chromobacterium amazonense]|uniref:EscU/YscU/HrcU family type III secretion system export apparatus switch protein n=1 Tax=Chromobacterium amazonense TaxID=1382803 RepID=UPI003B967B75